MKYDSIAALADVVILSDPGDDSSHPGLLQQIRDTVQVWQPRPKSLLQSGSMQQLLDSPLAAAPGHLDRPAVVGDQEPATGKLTERLCLIHSGPPLDLAATRRWLRARLDPVFLPPAEGRAECS